MTYSDLHILFLNPPHSQSISRRYMCSYYSPKYLLPPHDLVQLASCVRAWNQSRVTVLDAIAEKYSEAQVVQLLNETAPDVIVAVTGVEVFGDDIACLERLKEASPSMRFGIFGYYPTCFPEEVLQKSAMDFILCREPERPLSAYLSALANDGPVDDIPGLAGRRHDDTIFVNPEQRLQQLDDLPFPDYTLVNLDRYEEAFFGKRCGAILSARGCPYGCTYCTTTYGRHTIMKSPETVVAEMEYLLEAGVKAIRFLDDTFTCNRTRVIALCKLILERKLHVPWSCLVRADTVDRELLQWMHLAGCERILVGIESYSPAVLARLNKRIDPATLNSQLKLIHDAGMQIVGHFIVGAPFETDADFEMTLQGALKAPIDFIIVNILTPYAGTPYFDDVSQYIDFSLLPYKCDYNDPSYAHIAKVRHNRLYAKFYLRPVVVWRQLAYFGRHPIRAVQMLIMFLR